MKKQPHGSGLVRPGALVLAAACACSLTACGASTENSVSVQSVSMLLGLDVTGVNAYTGVVESKNVQKVARDSNKTVDQLYVEVGDMVQAGDPLFSYDVDALQLSLDSAQLEVDQLKNSIANYDTQIAQLEKEKKSAASSEQLSYTLQIQTAQKDQAEAQYNLKVKEAELEKLEESMENTQVYAELTGMVQSISEDDPSSYITIQETDSYQIKGTANELNVYDLYVGEEVVIRSRVNDDVWYGTVSRIETGSTADDSTSSDSYYDSSSGETASKYNFYVELTDSESLLMGQHVYIEPNLGGDGDGLWLPAAYIVDEEDGSAYVWGADSKDKLAKLSLELGEYDPDLDSYEVLSGLTGEDYIAFPADGFSVGQSVVKYDSSYFAADDAEESEYEDWYTEDEELWDEDASFESYYYTDENDQEHYVDEDGVDYLVAEDGTLTEAQ